jgi:hypothetical protein
MEATGQQLQAGVVGAGGARVPAHAGQRPPRQDPAWPQDRRRRCRLAGGVAGAWPAAGQLRAPGGHPGAAGARPATANGRVQATPPRPSASKRPWKTPASSWTRSPPTCWAPRVGDAGGPGRRRTRPPSARRAGPRPAAQQAAPGAPGAPRPVRGPSRLLLRLALAHLEHLEGAIAALDRRVDAVIAPFARARRQLATITGWVSGPRRRSSPRSAWT